MSRRWWSAINVVVLGLIVLGVSRLEATPAVYKKVHMTYNGLAWTIDTPLADVAEVVLEQVGSYDQLQISPSPETLLLDGMTIAIQDASSLALNATVAGNLTARQTQLAEIAKPPAPPKPPSTIYSGLATWYRFGDKLTAASRKYPRGTTLRVVAVNSGKSVDVVINDYGPSALTGVDLDLNAVAFARLAPLGAGKIKIKYYKI